jgi:hypothetical protein
MTSQACIAIATSNLKARKEHEFPKKGQAIITPQPLPTNTLYICISSVDIKKFKDKNTYRKLNIKMGGKRL